MAKKRKGFTWTRKKAWAVCKGKQVLSDRDETVLLFGSEAHAEDNKEYSDTRQTVRPCEIIVKVKGD